jgi:hypothetical protein
VTHTTASALFAGLFWAAVQDGRDERAFQLRAE